MKKILTFTVLGLMIVVLLMTKPHIKEINLTQTTNIYRLNQTDYKKETTIMIEGRHYKYFYKANKFVGQITIDGYPLTHDYKMLDISFDKKSGKIHYDSIQNGIIDMFTLGDIIADDNFENILLLIYETEDDNHRKWSTNNGLFITLPSTSRSKSLEQVKVISKESTWLDKTDWRKIK